MGYGWVANTTDDILSHKPQLYDTLVTIPPSYTAHAKEKVWPKLEIKKGGPEIKATQRDLRRYRILRRELRRLPSSPHTARHTNGPESSIHEDLPFIENTQETYDDASSTLDAQLVEPQSWSALAYDSFVWWASAGEKRTDLDEEEEYDAALLQRFDVSPYQDEVSPMQPRSASRKSPGNGAMMGGQGETQPAGLEMTIIAYFHRFTTRVLKTLADVVDANDDVEMSDEHYRDADGRKFQDSANGHATNQNNAEEATNRTTTRSNSENNHDEVFPNSQSECRPIFISTEDMSRMGLDIWSESDRDFVRELVKLYWGREADVRGGRVECCGVRICCWC